MAALRNLGATIMRILIVDDDDLSTEMLANALRSSDTR